MSSITSPPAAPVRRARIRASAPLAVVAVIPVVLYLNALTGAWHFDDFYTIVDNPYIRDLGRLPQYFTDARTFSVDPNRPMYRPLLVATFAVNYALGGYDTWGYHIANIALHIAAAALVFALAREFSPDRRAPAVVAGLIFATHAVGTEAVTYISSRSSMLAAGWSLAAVYAYLRALKADAHGRRWYGASVLLFIGALLSKASGVSVIGLIPLAHVMHVPRAERGAALRALVPRLAPFVVLGLGYVVLRELLLGTAVVGHLVRPLDHHLYTQLHAWMYYLGLLLYPVGLSICHDFPVADSLAAPVVLASAAALGALVVVACALPHRYRLMSLGILWMGVALLPESAAPLNLIVNERRLYLPLAGWSFIAATVITIAPFARMRWLARAAGMGVLLASTALAVTRNHDWLTERSVWMAAVRVDPGSALNRNNMGLVYLDAGHPAKAEREFRNALAIDANLEEAYNNLGNLYAQQKNWDAAIERYRDAVTRHPGYATAWRNLGKTHLMRGNLTAAEEALGVAYRLRPYDKNTVSLMGEVALARGRIELAKVNFMHALELDARFLPAYIGLGQAWERQRRPDAAAAIYETGLGRMKGDASAEAALRRALDRLAPR